MNQCLERLEQIIRIGNHGTCRRIKDDESLEIMDWTGLKVVAEMVPGNFIRIGYPVTPRLDEHDKSIRASIYEFILPKIGEFALLVLYEYDQKIMGVAAKFPCRLNDTAEIEDQFILRMEELRLFWQVHYSEITAFLLKNGVR